MQLHNRGTEDGKAALDANAGDTGDLGSIPGGGNGNPFRYSCLEKPMDRGASLATVHGSEVSVSTEGLMLSLYPLNEVVIHVFF